MERLRWEEEARRAEEEESNLLAATKLDMEMLSRRVIVGGTKKLSMNQQHALQLRLEEAMACISASESEVMALASKKEAKVTKQLQASEMAVQQLQQVIADMTLAEEETKEAMDELHHES